MEFHQLTYFLAAAQTQNFRKAADLCIVAQSALSRQIAALEKELDVSLFTRQKKRVILDTRRPGICTLCTKCYGTVAGGPAVHRGIGNRPAWHYSYRVHRIPGDGIFTCALC